MSLIEGLASGQPEIANSIDQVRYRISCWRNAGKSVAFVPTMGNLHEGHLALIEKARASADRVVVSIFVNPTQFAPGEDFDTYPRTFDDDYRKLSEIHTNLVFAPEIGVIYPGGNTQGSTIVDVPGLSDVLEGEHRPGFFKGVATVVNKLLNIVQPDIAVFGEKDFQQVLVVTKMVYELALPVEVLTVPTVRESDGLALSSRNRYLNPEQRKQASGLYACLQHLVKSVQDGVDINFAVVHANQELENQGFLVDYVVIRRRGDLDVPNQGDNELIALAAVHVGSTRLIDNYAFELKPASG